MPLRHDTAISEKAEERAGWKRTFGNDSDSLRNSLGGDRMITSDHDDLNTGRSAFSHSVGHGSARRIDHGDKTEETQVVQGKVAFFRVKRISLGELVSRQLKVAETNDTFSESTEFEVGRVESVLQFVVKNLFLSINEDGTASFENSLRSALHAEQVSAFGCFVHGHMVLVGRVEGNFAHFGVLFSVVDNISHCNFHALQNGRLRSVTSAFTKCGQSVSVGSRQLEQAWHLPLKDGHLILASLKLGTTAKHTGARQCLPALRAPVVLDA